MLKVFGQFQRQIHLLSRTYQKNITYSAYNGLQAQTNSFLNSTRQKSRLPSSQETPTHKKPKILKQNNLKLELSPSILDVEEIGPSTSSQSKIRELERSQKEAEEQVKRLKKQIEDTININENRLVETQNITDVSQIVSPQQTVDDTDLSKQLFGQFFEEEMVLLCNNIFCKKKIYYMATGCSHRASHVARRLIEGIYTKDAIATGTFSGNTPKSDKPKSLKILHCGAKHAIIEFSMNFAEQRNWAPQSVNEVKRAMTQKVSEIKREIQKNV